MNCFCPRQPREGGREKGGRGREVAGGKDSRKAGGQRKERKFGSQNDDVIRNCGQKERKKEKKEGGLHPPFSPNGAQETGKPSCPTSSGSRTRWRSGKTRRTRRQGAQRGTYVRPPPPPPPPMQAASPATVTTNGVKMTSTYFQELVLRISKTKLRAHPERSRISMPFL